MVIVLLSHVHIIISMYSVYAYVSIHTYICVCYMDTKRVTVIIIIPFDAPTVPVSAGRSPIGLAPVSF